MTQYCSTKGREVIKFYGVKRANKKCNFFSGPEKKNFFFTKSFTKSLVLHAKRVKPISFKELGLRKLFLIIKE